VRGGASIEDIASGWRSLQAVYPELQDWTAHRGHGGAAPWDAAMSPAAITALAAKSDVVVVQFHAGFQFMEAGAARVQEMAHAAIDAGADIVVCHHPHVLQGLEWYKGKLIAYSLGNFVFDQDMLPTFGSAILRTIWERHQLVEARLVPIEIERYRPMPASGAAARLTLERVWERSLLGAYTAPLDATYALVAEPGPNVTQAHLAFEHDTGRILPSPPPSTDVTLRVEAGAIAAIPLEGLVDARLGLAVESGDAILVGRDVFQWGRFEEELADGEVRGDPHWELGGCDVGVVFSDAPTRRGYLRLQRSSLATQGIEARPTARTNLVRHRFYDRGQGGVAVPLDPAASYSLHFKARKQGHGTPSARIELFHFDDSNLTESPSSDALATLDMPISIEEGGDWQEVDLRVDSDKLGPLANAVAFRFRFAPEVGRAGALDVDDVAFVEWRPAARMLDRMARYDLVRNDGPEARELSFRGFSDK
jgi:hypothetical protein